MLIAQVLPIGISGLGVREGAFVIFLTPFGVPAEQAVALGLLLYLLNLVASLLGAPAFAVGGRRGPSHRLTTPRPASNRGGRREYRERRMLIETIHSPADVKALDHGTARGPRRRDPST